MILKERRNKKESRSDKIKEEEVINRGILYYKKI